MGRTLRVTVPVPTDCEVEVVSYTPPYPGRWGGPPDNWAPAEPEEIEVVVRDPEGNDVTSEISEEAYEKCCEAALEAREADREP